MSQTKLITRMNALKEAIADDTKNLAPGYQIGHSCWHCRVIRA